MTEDQIERKVERMIAHLDHLLACRQISRRNYDKAIREIYEWFRIKPAGE